VVEPSAVSDISDTSDAEDADEINTNAICDYEVVNLEEENDGYDATCHNDYVWMSPLLPMRPPPTYDDPTEFSDPIADASPLLYFNEYFTNELLEHLAFQSNLYSVQLTTSSVQTSAQELRQYIGILMRMGISRLPQYKFHWSSSTRCPIISAAMSVNRFQKLKRFLHFNDNCKQATSDSRLYKVEPLIGHIRQKCRSLEQEYMHSIDEQIFPTKGRSPLRQYLPNKPHKWGIKVWARAGKSGILYDFDIYCGKDATADATAHESPKYGCGGNVVVRLCASLPPNQQSHVTFDNYFTNVPMLEHLASRNILAIGTIRSNRTRGADKLLPTDKQLKKGDRGMWAYQVEEAKQLCVVKWFDNSVVNVASNYHGPEAGDSVRRFSRKERTFVNVPCPAIIHRYNETMGGVDLFDMLMSLYRISVRSNKWYHYVFYYCIHVATINSWLLYRRHEGQRGTLKKDQLSLVSFMASISDGLIRYGQTADRKRGRPSVQEARVVGTSAVQPKRCRVDPVIRYDQTGHWPVYHDSRQKCRHCLDLKRKPPGYTNVRCSKCDMSLCMVKDRNCFTSFHSNS
jgi:hypothetical protein